MDRAFACGAKGYEFKSHRAHIWRAGRTAMRWFRKPVSERNNMFDSCALRLRSCSSTDRVRPSEGCDGGSIPLESTKTVKIHLSWRSRIVAHSARLESECAKARASSNLASSAHFIILWNNI